MTWTTAVSQVTGTLITASIYNGQLIGNLNHLRARVLAQLTYKPGANITTTSTSFIDVDATNLNLSFSNETPQLVILATMNNIGSAGLVYFDIIINSTTRLGHATVGLTGGSTANGQVAAMARIAVTPGTNNAKLQFRTDGTNTGIDALHAVRMMAWEV